MKKPEREKLKRMIMCRQLGWLQGLNRLLRYCDELEKKRMNEKWFLCGVIIINLFFWVSMGLHSCTESKKYQECVKYHEPEKCK